MRITNKAYVSHAYVLSGKLRSSSIASGYQYATEYQVSQALAAMTIFLSIALTGCATIISGTSQKMTFDSSPPDAKIIVNGEIVGSTPATLDLRRDANTIISIQKAGYVPEIFPPANRLNPAFWFDIALLSPIGIVVDLGTGASLKYDPDNYQFTLHPLDKGLSLMNAEDMRSEVSQFVANNYGAIGHELHKDKGEHLVALLGILRIKAADQPLALKVLLNVYEANHTLPKFTDALLLKFGLLTK
jgi:hypothetical protein